MAIAVEQPDIRQKMATGELLLCNDVICPAAASGELSGDSQLTLDLRPGESIGWFHFDESFAVVCHFNQEVGNDVTALLAITTFSAVRWRAVEEFDFNVVFQLLPCVPDRQGLFLNVENLGTSHESHGRGSFELALATDRSALFRTGYQQKRAGRAAPKAERGDVGRIVGIGHREGLCFKWRDEWAHAALRRLWAVLEPAREAVDRFLPLEPLARWRLAGRILAWTSLARR